MIVLCSHLLVGQNGRWCQLPATKIVCVGQVGDVQGGGGIRSARLGITAKSQAAGDDDEPMIGSRTAAQYVQT